MKKDKRFLREFARKHKVISSIIIFSIFVVLLILLTLFCSWMSANGQLSSVGSVIVEVVSIALGLILAFSYDSWMKHIDLDEDKKNILLGIKQELGTIINKINNDNTLSEILSQKTYYFSILNTDSVQKILDTTHFQMISELYNKMEYYYNWFNDKSNQLSEGAHLLDRHFSEIYNINLSNFDYSDWLKLLCQILFLSNHDIEQWISIKRDNGVEAIVRRFEINSINFIDDASVIEKQNLLAQIFPQNNRLFEIAHLRNLGEALPIEILNNKRREYFKRQFFETDIDYADISNLIFNSFRLPICQLYRGIDNKYHKKLSSKNIYVYNVFINRTLYMFTIKSNKESLFFSWVTKNERRNFYRNILADE